MGESNPHLQVENLPSLPLDERAITVSGSYGSRTRIARLTTWYPTLLEERAVHSTSAPGGNRTHIAPLEAAALQAARRTTARPKAFPISAPCLRSPARQPRCRGPSGSGTGGSRTHTLQGLSLGALPVGVPCLFNKWQWQ